LSSPPPKDFWSDVDLDCGGNVSFNKKRRPECPAGDGQIIKRWVTREAQAGLMMLPVMAAE
jgi:hypothetical protein